MQIDDRRAQWSKNAHIVKFDNLEAKRLVNLPGTAVIGASERAKLVAGRQRPDHVRRQQLRLDHLRIEQRKRGNLA
jgi:hypothetical protein